MRSLSCTRVSLHSKMWRALKGHPNNIRTHPAKQIRRLEQSIQQFGFTNPLLVDENNVILAGHARWQAAKALGLKPVFYSSSGLT
jgi:ParB-like chromosome segregation protein Spo0J